jgi:hypothetical protein
VRKLKIIEHISLDGVIQVSGDDGDFPYGDWTAPYRTPAGRDAKAIEAVWKNPKMTPLEGWPSMGASGAALDATMPVETACPS